MRQELSGAFCQRCAAGRWAGSVRRAGGALPGAPCPALFWSRAKPALSKGHWAALQLKAGRSHTKPGICLSTGFPARQHFAGALTKPRHPDFPLQGPAGSPANPHGAGPRAWPCVSGKAPAKPSADSPQAGLGAYHGRRQGGRACCKPPEHHVLGMRPRPGSAGRVRPGTAMPRPLTGPWPFNHRSPGVKCKLTDLVFMTKLFIRPHSGENGPGSAPRAPAGDHPAASRPGFSESSPGPTPCEGLRAQGGKSEAP